MTANVLLGLTTLILLAQVAAGGLGSLVITAIVLAAVVGIALVAVRASGIVIPSYIYTIIWIVLIAALAIVAIKFLLGLA